MAMKSRTRMLVVGGAAVVVVGVALWVVLAPGSTPLTITYVGGAQCVTFFPATPPEIWQTGAGNVGRPKKAKWIVTRDQRNEYYWEIDYDPASGVPGKPDGTGDYLSPSGPITCTGDQYALSPTVPDQGGDVDWPYKVTVYECDGGNQGDELCALDPVIWIRR